MFHAKMLYVLQLLGDQVPQNPTSTGALSLDLDPTGDFGSQNPLYWMPMQLTKPAYAPLPVT